MLLKFTPIIFVVIFKLLPKKSTFLVRIGRPHFDCIAIYNVSDSPDGAKRSLCRYLLRFRHVLFLVESHTIVTCGDPRVCIFFCPPKSLHKPFFNLNGGPPYINNSPDHRSTASQNMGFQSSSPSSPAVCSSINAVYLFNIDFSLFWEARNRKN